MEDTFTKWMAAILFFAFVVFAGVWCEKKKINAMVEFPEEEVVVVESDCIDLVIYVHEVGKQEINAESI